MIQYTLKFLSNLLNVLFSLQVIENIDKHYFRYDPAIPKIIIRS